MSKPLPILAETFILLMLVAAIVPVSAQTTLPTPTAKDPDIRVVSIPEDDQLRNTGVMWLGLEVFSGTELTARTTQNVQYTRMDPDYGMPETVVAIDEATITNPIFKLDPTGAFKGTDSIIYGHLWSQYKLMVTYQDGLPGQSGSVGVPLTTLISAGSALFFCDVYEKDKVEPKVPEIPAVPKIPEIGELVKTDLTDVSRFYTCKLRASGEAGVYVVDIYYTGPQTSAFVADEIVIFKVELLPAATGLKTPAWGMDMQDLCMLAWPFGDPYRLSAYIPLPPGFSYDWQKFPHLIPKPEHRWIWSSPDPLDGYSNCQEAVLFQKTLLGSGIPTGI